MTEKQTDIIDTPTRQSIDNVMGTNRPATLGEAVRMDLNALLPQSDIAIERRRHALMIGRNVLIGVGITVATAAAAMGILKLDEATKQPVGSAFDAVGQGDTVDQSFPEVIDLLESKTGMDLDDTLLRTPASDAKGDLLDQISDKNGVYQPASYTVEVSRGGVLGLPYLDVDASTKANTHIDDPDAPKD